MAKKEKITQADLVIVSRMGDAVREVYGEDFDAVKRIAARSGAAGTAGGDAVKKRAAALYRKLFAKGAAGGGESLEDRVRRCIADNVGKPAVAALAEVMRRRMETTAAKSPDEKERKIIEKAYRALPLSDLTLAAFTRAVLALTARK